MASETQQYKMLLFFKRNPKLSPAEFKEYYEANHVPMVADCAKDMKGLLTYTRRYLLHDASDASLGLPFTTFGSPAPTVPYDICNEVTFESKEAAQAFAKEFYGHPINGPKIIKDEEHLFLRDHMRGMLIEEVKSS